MLLCLPWRGCAAGQTDQAWSRPTGCLPRLLGTQNGPDGDEGNIMTTPSRRQFLQRSGTFVGATMATALMPSVQAATAEKELSPKKFPFPPNDQFGNYEPTITGDGNTIYFARFASTGDKRVS